MSLLIATHVGILFKHLRGIYYICASYPRQRPCLKWLSRLLAIERCCHPTHSQHGRCEIDCTWHLHSATYLSWFILVVGLFSFLLREVEIYTNPFPCSKLPASLFLIRLIFASNPLVVVCSSILSKLAIFVFSFNMDMKVVLFL